MAICSNCGYEITDGSAFCQQCGAKVEPQVTPINPEPQAAPEPTPTPVVPQSTPVIPSSYDGAGMGGADPYKPKKSFDIKSITSNKKLCGIIGGVVGAILLIVIITKIFGGGSPQAQIKAMIKAYNKRSTSYSTIDKSYMNEYRAAVEKTRLELQAKYEMADFDSLKEYAEDMLEDGFDEFDDEFGDDWKMSVEIKKVKDIKKSADEFERMEDYWDSFVEGLEDSAENYEDRADRTSDSDEEDYYTELAEKYEKYANKYGKYKVTAVKEIKVKVSIKGDDDKDSETTTMYFAKVGGKWICMRGGIF